MENEFEPISARGEAQVAEYRRHLLEGVAGLETPLDAVLALYLGAGKRGQETLYRDVIWRLSYETRIELVTRLLSEDEWIEYYPFIRDYLPEVVGVRNVLAHMVLDILESSDDELVFHGRRRGDDQTRRLKVRRLYELTMAVFHVQGDLWSVHERLGKEFGKFVPSTEELPVPSPTDPSR